MACRDFPRRYGHVPAASSSPDVSPASSLPRGLRPYLSDKGPLSPQRSGVERSRAEPPGRGARGGSGGGLQVCGKRARCEWQAGMGAPGRPLLLLLPLGAFLLLLSLASLRLHPPLSACLSGGRPCRWFGGTPAHKEGPEKLLLLVPTPTKEHDAPREAHDAPSVAPVCNPSLQGSGFRIQDMQSAFLASLTPEGEVLIREYLQGWKELIKFMDSLGAAFGLISRETRGKISVLEQHRAGRHGRHYRSLQAMAAYELDRGLVDFGRSPPPPAPRLPSGCRTLLRLHRALKWLELFLHKLGGVEGGGEEEGSPEASQMCAEAYRAALAPFHGWWVRQAASLAFLAMPSRRELLRNLCADQGPSQARGVLRATVRSLARVYNATQEVYAGRGMLDLP